MKIRNRRTGVPHLECGGLAAAFEVQTPELPQTTR
jgi:hypothetical protein